MAIINEKLVNNVSLAIGATITTGQQMCSSAVDNTTNQDLDAGVMIMLTTGATITTAYVNVYAVGSSDSGTTYSDGVTPGGAVTLTSPTNAKIIGVINTPTAGTGYKAGPFSVASAFGYLPGKWAIIVENKTATSLVTVSALYERIQGQSN